MEIKRIEQITSDLKGGNLTKPNFQELYEEITQLSQGGSGSKKRREHIADLYIKTKKEEWFFEIKTCKPNKGECISAIQTLLEIKAMRINYCPWIAIPYNPYGLSKSDYTHSPATNIFDMNSILLEAEFWDKIGGKGTYQELLSIFQDVGKVIQI